ncbi:hypothetical protein [Pseudoxanthomonas sacheonensis]|uniref:Uncharacterized protein n=1 Tax=Pseudoxanthomonas sacheonensis TaxID=443615 RepID=A0ABU1RND2_9GAMM|nr:hypothetical protein [Pseudoxanthomonas sacheonensis]MDR6840287.1 hypothetical protein [Pseudoxanthomonas sacheonensis]
MQYQLVLQFNGDSLSDYDALIALEDDLIQELGNTGDVDGHDIGSGETNIFILTLKPEITFHRAKAVLDRTQLLGAVTAAYRAVTGQTFTVLWPAHRQEFRVA